jgi:phenylalanyl-tRNA synthetase beta chain
LLGADPETLVRLVNPMSREHEVLRPNLLGGLLRACAHNLRQGLEAVRLFEVGHGFAWSRAAVGAGPARQPSTPPVETWMLAALVTGPRYVHAHDDAQRPMDFGDAKGLWEAWLEELRVDTPEWRSYAAEGWKPGASAEVATTASRIGWAGTLGQSVLREWGIEAQVHVFVALLDPLLEAQDGRSRVLMPGRFPPARRDVAFFVPIDVTHRQLEGTLAGAAGERLSSIELFDIYAGPGTPQDMKSMAYALTFQHPERTMTEGEVQDIQDRMVAAIATDCGGRLRER